MSRNCKTDGAIYEIEIGYSTVSCKVFLPPGIRVLDVGSNKQAAAIMTLNCPKWLLHNEVVFTQPLSITSARYNPGYAVMHMLPENRKSQFTYLRPDLGTQIFLFDDLDVLETRSWPRWTRPRPSAPRRSRPSAP